MTFFSKICCAVVLTVVVLPRCEAKEPGSFLKGKSEMPGSDSPAKKADEKYAFLLIDTQDCFLDQDTTNGLPGTLAVNDASRILPKINSIRAEKDCLFDLVVRSQDFHPSGHVSWASSNFVSDLPVGAPIPVKCILSSDGRTADAACCADSEGAVNGQPVDPALKGNLTKARTTQALLGNPACDICFNESSASECYDTIQAMWPDHCPQTGDSTFPPSLITKDTDVIVQKGLHQWVDAYSAFFDNTRNLRTPLEGILKEHGITHLYVAGIATDFCVFWSAKDAVDLGFSVTLIQDASAGIGIPTTGNDTTITEAIADMKAKGVKFMNTADLLDIPCASEITTTTTSSAAHAPMFLAFFLIAAGLATPY